MSFPASDPGDPLEPIPSPASEPRLLTRRDASASAITPDTHTEHPRPTLFQRLRRPARPAHALSRATRRLVLAMGVVVLLLAVALLASAGWLRHSMRAALPQLDGALHVAGLAQPVTVARDAQGVPSLQAASLDDLLFAQGFVTAQDRLWQMDMLRRHASGNLAELLGSKLVPHDSLQRTLQLRAAADRAVAQLPPGQLHQFDAYARGVNAFLQANAGHLPVEFHLLHYTPAPWSARDSILVYLAMFQDLSTEFPTKLRREAFSAHMAPELLADLYPVGSWRDHPPNQEPPDLVSEKPDILQIPLDESQSSLHKPQLADPGDILRLSHQFPSQDCDGCRAGSNNWAVAGSRSASGFPLLSNDMHLSLSVPDIWYETGLHAPATAGAAALDVTGFTMPGIPFILVGRNAHVAWGFTNLGADVQDVHIEHLRGAGSSMEFQRPNGSWAPVGHHPEHIAVRGGRDRTLDVLTTLTSVGAIDMETPLISALTPTEHRALSLAWTIYDPSNLNNPFAAADTAADGASLVAAFASFGGPSLNLLYADDAKHIGYHALGRIPIRGPATQHPRTTPLPVPAVGPAPPDEDDDTQPAEPTPTTELHSPAFAAPRLIQAAYFRPRRRVARAERPAARRPRPRAAAQVEEPATPAIPTRVIPAAASAIDYSIGSAISPVPVDALDAAQQWSGYIPYSALPSVVDPANGVLATANARVTRDDYPYAVTLDWMAPYRAERIYKVLGNRTGLRPDDMLGLQNDVHSEYNRVFAERLAYALDHASTAALAHDPKRLHQAADILRAWDGAVTPDSAAAALVTTTARELWPLLLEPQIAAHDKTTHIRADPDGVLELYTWHEQTVALESLVTHQPARWLPPGTASWNDLLTLAASHALANAHAPSNVSNWHFSTLSSVEIDHPVFSLSPFLDRLLGTPTGTGRHPTGGDPTTVKSFAGHVGPSERFTADLADPNATTANITTGQSGNPASPYYLDQFTPWLNGTTFQLPLATTQATHTLTLLP